MSVTVDSTDGASLEEIANAFVAELKGKNLKKDGEAYTFTFDNGNGVNSDAVIVTDSGKYALIVVTGRENAPEEVAQILSSIKQ
ncbi:MAG: hypothetical protein IJG37_03435, partial [Synergistaceae bacterium]|nr:hypothetical protein [Synergistaceae bacterium]